MYDYYAVFCATGNALLPVVVATRVRGWLRPFFCLIGLVHGLEFFAQNRTLDNWVTSVRLEYAIIAGIVLYVLNNYNNFPVYKQRTDMLIWVFLFLILLTWYIDREYVTFERWDYYIGWLSLPFLLPFAALPLLKIRDNILVAVSNYAYMHLILILIKSICDYKMAWMIMHYADPLIMPVMCLSILMTGTRNERK